MVKKEKTTIDWCFFALSGVLIFWGIITVILVSLPLSLEHYGVPWFYALNQTLKLAGGVLLGFFAFKIDINKLKKIALPLFLANLLCSFLVFLPYIGSKSKGAHRWLDLGFFQLQPSEFLKITLLIYLAVWLSSKKYNSRKLFLFFLIILMAIFVCFFPQKDLSTLIVIIISAVSLFFIKGARAWQIALLVLLLFAGFSIFVFSEGYRLERILTIMNPLKDPLGKGYHLQQAKIAIGSGGLLGAGNIFAFGMSRQKFGFLPEAYTDSIFAVMAEELGFVGSCLLLLLFLLFLWRIFRIGAKAENTFKGYLAFGIGVWITSQAFFNIGGISGIIPLGGVPLPFFSYGGSHLIAELIAVGLVLNISKK